MNIIHPNAKIAEGVEVGPFTTISDDVEIGRGSWIGPNVSIMAGTRIGENCRIFPGAIVGAVPQDLKFEGEESLLKIGNDVTIREYCTINRGTRANYVTDIGDGCLLMAYVHIAHDCILGEKCVLANNVNLAGHIEIGDYVILGGLTAVHQFVKIGQHAFIGGGSLVRKDVPPFVKAAREPLSYVGVNTVGLKRRGFTPEQISNIQEMYRILYVRGNNTSQALKIIESRIPDSKEKDLIVSFVRNAHRGIMKGFRQINQLNGSHA